MSRLHIPYGARPKRVDHTARGMTVRLSNSHGFWVVCLQHMLKLGLSDGSLTSNISYYFEVVPLEIETSIDYILRTPICNLQVSYPIFNKLLHLMGSEFNSIKRPCEWSILLRS